jgi:hypothetical protein
MLIVTLIPDTQECRLSYAVVAQTIRQYNILHSIFIKMENNEIKIIRSEIISEGLILLISNTFYKICIFYNFFYTYMYTLY